MKKSAHANILQNKGLVTIKEHYENDELHSIFINISGFDISHHSDYYNLFNTDGGYKNCMFKSTGNILDPIAINNVCFLIDKQRKT